MDFAQGLAALSPLAGLAGALFSGGQSAEKPGSAPPPKEDAEVVGGSARADANAKASLDEAADDAAKDKKPGGKPADRGAAFAELKRRTMDKMKNPTAGRAKKVSDTLSASYDELAKSFNAGKGKDPGSKDAYIAKKWFDAFYYLKCKDYAIDLIDAGNQGTGAPSLTALIKTTETEAKKKKGGDMKAVKGRSTTYTGMTVGELAAAEKANPTMQPGCAVHVKLHFEEPVPYQTSPDAHHWIVYDGNGLFTHSFGQGVSGDKMDGFLAAFAKKYFKTPAWSKLWKDKRFSAEPGKGVPRGDLMPRVSAVYDPKEAGGKNKGGDA